MALARVASVVSALAAVQVEAGLHVPSWSMYPGYDGNLTIAGPLTIGQTNDNKIVLEYSLTGADTACNGTDNGKANTCGVHVHSGTSCAEASGVGGHYFTTSSDPWLAAQYTADGMTGATMAKNMIVMAGTTLAQNKGRVFVVHDADGTRIACGVLTEDATSDGMYADKFSKYPGYTGALAVMGSVEIHQGSWVYTTPASTATVLSFSLTGTDPACKEGADFSKANACGIHVHSGPCTAAAGHYFDSSVSDPWLKVMYFADSMGKTGASVTSMILTKETTASMKGRSVVIHDLNGARVGCSDISNTKTVAAASSSVQTSAGILAAFVTCIAAFVHH